jgi:hypothetical protein
MKKKKIDKKFDELFGDGVGYGDPDAKWQAERKFQLLMHKQMEKHERTNTIISYVNLIFALINILLIIYQVFFR